MKRARRGVNQDVDIDVVNNDNAEDDDSNQEDIDNDVNNELGPWPEVEDRAISKGKMKGPARGQGGNRGQGNKGKGKKFVVILIAQ